MEITALLLLFIRYAQGKLISMANDETDQKLKLLELVSNWAESESDRTWKRNSFFLTINTAIVAIIALLMDPINYPAIAIVSGFSIILSYVWFKIIPLSKYYESRWHNDMERIIESNETIKNYIKGRSKEQNMSRPSKMGSTEYIKVIPISLIIIWFIILIWAIYKLITLG